MKIFQFIILVLFTTLFLSCEEEDSNISEAEIILIGNKLAEWGDGNCQIISIEDQPILWQGPNSGGCSEVYFELRVEGRKAYYDFEALRAQYEEAGAADWFIDREISIREAFLANETMVKQNLSSAIDDSNCEASTLISSIDTISTTTGAQEIIEILSCAGSILISDGYSGIE
ncbi:hypothetical protein [Marinoscillum sp. MHG1-6]|uniref:hypothetical protein n=1 Tax=Marinoscillum sp. MHG1-6 TaxID=2959627 RepID=UPI00215799E5|nr:hypothetical protein [Marinoscillum sp. MHG1-6]